MKLLLLLCLLLSLLSLALSESSPLWLYGDWQGDCTQSQCGYGLLERVANCVVWDTGEEVDPSQCNTLYGAPIERMECTFSQPDPKLICGGEYGLEAYNCLYNQKFDEQDEKSLYMTCHCKEGWTGSLCDIPPPNPGPKPDPEPSKDGGITWRKVGLYVVIIFAVVGAAALGVFAFLKYRNRQKSASVSPNDGQIQTDGDGRYMNMEGAQDQLYA